MNLTNKTNRRRIWSLVAMLMTLALTCGAFAEGNTFTTKYFTLELPEEVAGRG